MRACLRACVSECVRARAREGDVRLRRGCAFAGGSSRVFFFRGEEKETDGSEEGTEAARFLSFNAAAAAAGTAAARRLAREGAKDASDLKRYEKEHGVLGVNLGSGLSAGGGLTLHQELIMTMPGTGKLYRRATNPRPRARAANANRIDFSNSSVGCSRCARVDFR